MSESNSKDSQMRANILQYLYETQPLTGQKFIFQVFDKEGRQLVPSQKTSTLFRHAPLGFSDKTIDQLDWRIYATFNSKQQTKIVIAELYHLRRELADDIARSNANILLVTYPIFGLLVWFIISLALRSITRVTTEISNRASTFLEPVKLTQIPFEIKPLVAELNELFIRLK